MQAGGKKRTIVRGVILSLVLSYPLVTSRPQQKYAMNTIALIVRATPLVDLEDLHPLDVDVPGDWEIELEGEAKDWTESEMATAALDDFHDQVAIKVLDDFLIEVYTEDNEQLLEDHEEEDEAREAG